MKEVKTRREFLEMVLKGAAGFFAFSLLNFDSSILELGREEDRVEGKMVVPVKSKDETS